jgi:hypothetical protein
LEIDDVWCVSQLAKDFNPLHGHDGLISGVLYLKVPPQICPEKSPSGYLTFQHSNPFLEYRGSEQLIDHLLDFVHDQNVKSNLPLLQTSYSVAPIFGECWVFPSWLLHKVTSFSGAGERRCVAFNTRWLPQQAATQVTKGHHHGPATDLLDQNAYLDWERIILFNPTALNNIN